TTNASGRICVPETDTAGIPCGVVNAAPEAVLSRSRHDAGEYALKVSRGPIPESRLRRLREIRRESRPAFRLRLLLPGESLRELSGYRKTTLHTPRCYTPPANQRVAALFWSDVPGQRS